MGSLIARYHIMRSKILLLAVFVVAAFSVVTDAQAQGLTMRHSPRQMQGVRPLGMGGAFSAMPGTDENALFYNPAAINDYEKKVHMQFVLPTVEFSYKAIPFIASDIVGLADDIDAATTDSAKINVFDNFTTANAGRYEELGVHGSVAHFMHKYVAASLIYENRSVVALTNPTSTTVDIEALTQFGLQVGSAYAFFDDMLQAGLAIKFLERHLIDETVSQRDIIATDDFGDILDTDNFGFGVGVDAGVKAKLPIKNWKAWDYLKPTFALTLQDIGHTRFSNGLGRQEESLTWGFAVYPDYWKLKTAFAVDFRDLEHTTDFITKLHAGYEVTWPEISKILRSVSARIGVNQGYFAGGVGLDFKYAKLNFASWGREIGENTRQKESRMFGFQLAAGF